MGKTYSHIPINKCVQLNSYNIYEEMTSCLLLKMSLTVRNSSRISTMRNVISDISHFANKLQSATKSCHPHFIHTGLFSDGLIYNQRCVPSHPTLTFSPSLALSLSVSPLLCPFALLPPLPF